MKKHHLILLYLCLSQFSIIAQVKVEFKNKETETITYTYGDEGETISAVSIRVCQDTLDYNLPLRISVENVTSAANCVSIRPNSFHIAKETLMKDTLYFEVQLKLKNSKEDDQGVFRLYVYSDSISKDVALDTKTFKTKVKKSTDYEKLMRDSDSLVLGTLSLDDNGIFLYEKVKSFHRKKLREDYETFMEENNHPKLPWRDKWFRKHFKVVEVKGKPVSVDVEFVDAVVAEGRLRLLKVKTDNNKGVYLNKGPISLTNFHARRYYRLHYSGSDLDKQGQYIILSDVLSYVQHTGRAYFPSSTDFRLNKEHAEEQLKCTESPFSLLDGRFYTDPKGLSGEANGLAQSEINAKFILNSNNLSRSYMTLFQRLSLRLMMAKFDSDHDTLVMNTFDNRRNQDVLRLMRNSNVAFNIELDLISASWVHDVYWKLGHQINHTKVRDTASVGQHFERVFTPVWYTTLGGTLHVSPRISANFQLPLSFAYTFDQPFKNYDKDFDFYIAPEIELTFDLKKPKPGEDRKSSFVFTRIRYFDMPNYRGNNYWQLQMGVDFPITGMFK